MNRPFFSVIMPIYNRDKFLESSIQSVLDQHFTEFELICINDGSTDNSEKIITEFSKKDDRVKILTLIENKGRCIARNKGISNVKSNWICLLDSDDEFLPNHLSEIKKLIDENPKNLAFATEQTINNKPKQYPNSKFRRNKYDIKLEDVIHSNPISLNQLCYHHSLNLQFPNQRIPISEDWLFLRILLHKTTILKINVVTTIVNEHPDRTVNTVQVFNMAKWNYYTGIYFTDNFQTNRKTRNRIISHTNLLSANIILSDGNKTKARSYFKRSLSFRSTYFNLLFYKAIIKFLLR